MDCSPRKNIGVGCHSFLQGIFPTLGLNPGLLHCRQILYYLSHRLALIISFKHFPGGASGKESTYQCGRCKRCGYNSWAGKIPWRRKWQLALVFLTEKFQGQRSLVGNSPRGCKELDWACTYTYISHLILTNHLYRKHHHCPHLTLEETKE